MMKHAGLGAVICAALVAGPHVAHAFNRDSRFGDIGAASIWSRLYYRAAGAVTVELKKRDIGERSALQKSFIEHLIWPRYGKRTPFGRSLVARIDEHYHGLVRDKVVAQVRRKYPKVHLFGIFLDTAVDRIVEKLRGAPDDATYRYTIDIPRRFFVDNGKMDLEIEVVKDRVPRVDVYQITAKRKRLLVFTSLAAPGAFYQGFGSPTGIMYTSRYIAAPRWYPCATKWAEEPCRQPRGLNTAFGLHGMDLTRRDYLAGYGPKYGSGTVSPYLIHSTNHYGTPGRYASHGCVRIFPHKADDLFGALKHYFSIPNGTKTKDFGDISPFSKTIPVMLGSSAQIAVFRVQLRKIQEARSAKTAQAAQQEAEKKVE